MGSKKDNIERIWYGCQICGWEYGYRNTKRYGLKTCMECFDKHKYWPLDPHFRSFQNEIGDFYEYTYEYDCAARQYFAKERKENGFIDPEIKCSCCDKRKSIFEFSRQQGWIFGKGLNLNHLICYECEHTKDNFKKCWYCGKLVRREKFNNFNDDSICSACIKDRENKRLAEIEFKQNFYSDAQCIGNLRMRGIENPTQEMIELVRLGVLMRRTRNKFNYRRKHESDRRDVQGKQCKDEINHDKSAHFQHGGIIGGTAGV